jgi:hypothetical protein
MGVDSGGPLGPDFPRKKRPRGLGKLSI